jgi:hypothetical protein
MGIEPARFERLIFFAAQVTHNENTEATGLHCTCVHFGLWQKISGPHEKSFTCEINVNNNAVIIDI